MFFVNSESKFNRDAGLLAVAVIFLGCIFSKSAKAHLELYHNVEVNLTETADTGVVKMYFTIHSPELLVGFAEAGSEIFDAEWLRTRSDEEFQTIFEQGRIFVKEKFSFWVGPNNELDLTGLLRFEKPEVIRDENYKSGVPVACLLVSAEIKLDAGSEQLGVKLKQGAGKRLLLVCTRKGAFPETKDMDAGDSVAFILPERQAGNLHQLNESSDAVQINPSWRVYLGVLGLLGVVYLWRMKKMSR